MTSRRLDDTIVPLCPTACCFRQVCPTWIQQGVAPMWREGLVRQREDCWNFERLITRHTTEDEPSPNPEDLAARLGSPTAVPATPTPPLDLVAEVYPWWDDDLAVLDTETTGTDPRSCRMLSVAFLLVAPAGGLDSQFSLSTLVNPGSDVVIPPEAAAVHGLTEADIRLSGVAPIEVLQRIQARLATLQRAGAPLVIYNAPFDLVLIHTEAARVGVRLPQVPLLDPLCFDRHFNRYRKGGRKLATMAMAYGVELTGAHEAGADARAAVAILRVMAQRYPELRSMSLAELQRLQAEWHASWKSSISSLRRWPGS